jgi:SAM-dependent methyltransferase
MSAVGRPATVDDQAARVQTSRSLTGHEQPFNRVTDSRPNDSLHSVITEFGCGLGSPAGYIAKRFQCKVSGLDITQPFVEAGNRLTALLRMQ